MRWLLVLSAALFVAGYPSGARKAFVTPAVADSTGGPARTRALERVKARMPKGSAAEAREDAAQAAADREFALIATGGRFSSTPAGVICFTPGMEAPATLTSYGYGDVITPDVNAHVGYAAAYNQVLVERPDYPHRDLCRIRTDKDQLRAWDPSLVTKAARPVAGPPRDLFEAARRGNKHDVRRQLNPALLNAVDGVGMTALAWAVARDNQAAIRVLMAVGANPWQTRGNQRHGRSAVYWAAALGRSEFGGLAQVPARPFESWPSHYVAAAISGGDASILRHMLAEAHDPIRLELLTASLPEASMLELALKDQPDLATPLLFKALDYFDDRPDLVRLALAHGANPNAVQSYETPLAKASKGLADSSVEEVDLLLKAGADPNLMSHRVRPVWVAVGILHLDKEHTEIDDRATAIFHRLVAAGADLNRPDWQGRPPIWTLLFPYSYSHEELDASFVTPQLLEMLVRNGLDLNAKHKGKRILGTVEAQAGRDSELASTLRRLGATP